MDSLTDGRHFYLPFRLLRFLKASPRQKKAGKTFFYVLSVKYDKAQLLITFTSQHFQLLGYFHFLITGLSSLRHLASSYVAWKTASGFFDSTPGLYLPVLRLFMSAEARSRHGRESTQTFSKASDAGSQATGYDEYMNSDSCTY